MAQAHLKVRNGLTIKGTTSYPSDAEEGDIILRSDLTPPTLHIYKNGAWGKLADSSYYNFAIANNSATGANATVTPAANKPFVRLTDASLSSVDMVVAGNDGDVVVLSNATGNVVILNNDTGGTASNRILTGTMKPIKMKDGATVVMIYDATSARWRCIGGGGSGEGDTTDILESLKNQLMDSYFQLVTPCVFKVDESSLVSALSTGAYNFADESFNMTTGQTLVTENLLDPNEFLNNTDSVEELDLSVYWDPDNVDTAATYQVSRNGAVSWQTATMEQSGNTGLYRGYIKFSDTAINQNVIAQLTSNSNLDLNTTTSQLISQQFGINSGEKYLLRQVSLSLTKTGSPSGYLYVSLCADDGSGQPGTVLAESAAVNVTNLVTGANVIDIPHTYLAAGTYHLKIRTDATYKTSYGAGTKIQVQMNTSGSVPYMKINNGTTWSTSSTNNLTYIIKGIFLDLRLKITASTASKIDGFGVYYDKNTPASINSSSLNVEVFEFSGSLNTYTFTLTKFLPHPDLLKVYDVNTGQVYDYGSFTFSGNTVIFESGQFYSPGQTIKLRFIQVEGAAFDNSDVNALLLASNHLGSTDASIDRSSAGRGIFLRRPDGTLREICIDNSDNITVYSV